jgi:hypothetical protein
MIEQAAPAAPVPAEAQSPEAELASIPAIKQVIDGEIPAVYVDQNAIQDPELFQNLAATAPKIGLGTTVTPSQRFVTFNPNLTSTDEIAQADQAGTLDDIAAPLTAGGAAGGAEMAPAGPQALPQGQSPAAAVQGMLAGPVPAPITPKPPSQEPNPALGVLNDLYARPKV